MLSVEADPFRVLIAGLGNILLRDDGVGVHAVRELRKNPPPDCLALEVGTATMDAVPYLERAEAVVALDAVDAGGRPGTIYRFRLEDPPSKPIPGSLHELDLAVTLAMLPPEARPPVLVIGVQPCSLDLGLELSAPVRAVLPRLIDAARQAAEEIRSHGPGPESRTGLFSAHH
jgi:hydrogenase maturation protease